MSRARATPPRATAGAAAGAEAAARGEVLLAWARFAVAEAAGAPAAPPDRRPEWLETSGATFVTLTVDGRLRGCIGSLEARRPLLEDLRANARSAALHDPRFPPLTAPEAGRVVVEVSLLSPLEPLAVAGAAELAAALRPGVDGVLLELGEHRGTFLPQVWRSFPEPAAFVRQLERKAGFEAGAPWPAGARCWRYTVEKFV